MKRALLALPAAIAPFLIVALSLIIFIPVILLVWCWGGFERTES